MSRRSLHRRQRAQGGCLSWAIGLLAVAALALAAALFITSRMPKPKQDVIVPAQTAEADAPAETVAPGGLGMVVTADSFQDEGGAVIPVLTPSPTPTLEPTPTPKPTYNPDEPFALVRPQSTAPGFLPLFARANTEDKRIAITVDECSGAAIVTEFARTAAKYGAKLTLFPTKT